MNTLSKGSLQATWHWWEKQKNTPAFWIIKTIYNELYRKQLDNVT